jgi:hypothetical protein
VVGIRALFCELDREEPTSGAHLAMLRAAPLPPSLIIRSSLPHKLHPYWLVDRVGVDEFATLQAALIGIFGGDPACKNLSRVMRVPGFLHTKGSPILSTIVEATGARYTRDEMLAAFPKLGEALEREREHQVARAEAQARAASDRGAPDGDHARKYACAALQLEHDQVAGAPDGTRNDALNKAAFALGQLVGAGALERHEVEDALNGAAQTCGLESREAEATIHSGLEAGMREPREIPAPKAKRNWLEAKKEERAATGNSAAMSARPEIVVNGRWLREIVADCLAALEAANDPPTLYMRGTIAARVNGDKIEALTAISLKGRLDRVADFVKVTFKPGDDGGEPVPETNPARPPADVSPDILTQTSLPVVVQPKLIS